MFKTALAVFVVDMGERERVDPLNGARSRYVIYQSGQDLNILEHVVKCFEGFPALWETSPCEKLGVGTWPRGTEGIVRRERVAGRGGGKG